MNTRNALPESALFGKHLCVYCGALADSDDHAPSRCFLQRPLPSNLITLPACKKCNVKFSTDENIVTIIMALTSCHPDLRRDCQPGGRVHRALERDRRLRSLVESHRRADGNFELTGDLLNSFDRVFCKTVQGLYYGAYRRLVPKSELAILSIEDQRFITPDQVVARVRPPALRDITDMPLPELTPSSWMTRQPVFVLDLQPIGGEDAENKKVQRVFHLVSETPVDWIPFQPGVFTFGFVKAEDGRAVCILDLWKTWVVAVAAPWPDSRGPLRRGKRNRFSRDPKF